MKRFDKAHVTKTARDFAASTAADGWFMFGPEVQDALIDARIMMELRYAVALGDSGATFTATQIIEFRDAVAATLRAGVAPSGKSCKRPF